MGLNQIETTREYVDYLRAQPSEVDRLFKDLLIGVTSFFRDPLAFEELATKVLAVLVKEKEADAPIRIWVPGCATGEEAYSIAIVAAEQVAAAQSACRVQVFATDVDEHALEIARGGVYPASIALDMSPERLTRFFTPSDHHCTIVKSIRESVVFAVQNVIDDPPFSKLDLVSCRNLLIYLEPPVQEKLMAVFHFALNPGGYLFLGNAESIGPLEASFAPVSKRGRIFRRLGTAKRPPLDYPLPQATPADTAPVPAKAPPDPTVATLANDELLEHFAPAAVVVRRTGQIVHFYGAMDRYINLPTGEATLDVLTLARDSLKPTLRAAFHDAVRRNRLTVLETLDLEARQEACDAAHHGEAPRESERRRASVAHHFRDSAVGGGLRSATRERPDAGARPTTRSRAQSHEEGAAAPGRPAREQQRGAESGERRSALDERGAAVDQ